MHGCCTSFPLTGPLTKQRASDPHQGPHAEDVTLGTHTVTMIPIGVYQGMY